MTEQSNPKHEPAEGDFVKIVTAQNQAEAEFIQGLLHEEGVPSMLRRTSGFDVPDFLAAGPRDVLIPALRAQDGRDVLMLSDPGSLLPASEAVDVRRRGLSRLVLGLALIAIVAWCATELLV